MRWNSLVFLGLAASSTARKSGPVTESIAPEGKAPQDCQPSGNGRFQVRVEQLDEAQPNAVQMQSSCQSNKTLVMELNNGVLKDAVGRTGYIAANFQFQFDGPPQSGALYTSGFSLCNNGSLALGSSAIFYSCLSGSFSNLYDRHWAAQCTPVNIIQLPCAGSASDAQPVAAGGSTVGTSMVNTPIVTVLADGQPQVVTTIVPIPMCQIGDGQVQAHTTPCAIETMAPIPVVSVPVVSQIGDGQPQGPSLGPSSPVASEPLQSPAPSESQTGGSQPSGQNTAVVTSGPSDSPQAPAATDTAPPATAAAAAGRTLPGVATALAVALLGAMICL